MRILLDLLLKLIHNPNKLPNLALHPITIPLLTQEPFPGQGQLFLDPPHLFLASLERPLELILILLHSQHMVLNLILPLLQQSFYLFLSAFGFAGLLQQSIVICVQSL